MDSQKAKEIASSGALVLEEKKRPGEYFPIFEGDDFTAVLSSKDLRMVEHLKDMIDAGVDSLKIEGRMKSVYYVALVTRAYRKAIDAIYGKISSKEAEPFIAELENVSHRESGTGFYYNASDADKTVTGATDSRYILAAEITKKLSQNEEQEVLKLAEDFEKARNEEFENLHPSAKEARLRDKTLHPERYPSCATEQKGWFMYEINPLNMIKNTDTIEFVSPDVCGIKCLPSSFQIIDAENGTLRTWVCDSHKSYIYTPQNLQEGTLIRIEDPDYISGKIRDTGR